MTAFTGDRTPKPCLCATANHEHGTREAYWADKCRCDPCRAANASYARIRRKLAATGRTPTGWVDAEPARAHVARLRAAGLGQRTIAARAGINFTQLWCLIHGRGGKPPSRRIAGRTAQAILELPVPGFDDLEPSALIDGTGTRRRLQALVAVGWSQVELAERLGWSRENLYRVIHAYSGRMVEASTRRLVVDLYEQLSNVRPIEGPRRDIALTVAETHRWLPPAGWDDDTIDDPNVRPDAGGVDADDVDQLAIEYVLDGQPMALEGRDLEAAALALIEQGLGYEAIAVRCRVADGEDGVRRVLNTARKRMERAAAKEDAA